MRIVLVSMPWAAVDTPSLALGILKRAALESQPQVEVQTVYANVQFCDWVVRHLDFSLDDYEYYSAQQYFDGTGEWIFSGALPGAAELPPGPTGFESAMSARWTREQHQMSRALWELAPQFIGEVAAGIAELRPDMVGFTSTFQQNVASLAVASELKRVNPQIITVMGGANCDGPPGAVIHRNFGFIDFVVRGEGDVAFPSLLRACGGDGTFADIRGLCWRSADGNSHANPIALNPLAERDIAEPDFDDYFGCLDGSVVRRWAEPKLVAEGARGCWWGEKHHCTFCGLNGSLIKFRSKPPEEFTNELMSLAERYQCLDFIIVDNIMEMSYIKSMMPRLAGSGCDFRIHYEVKSNLRRRQLEELATGGVIHVQPGIENLSTRVLELMDKGVTGCQNVRFLRDAQSVGISAVWNYLYGFPGETEGDYDEVLRQLPALHHLTPPADVVRIVAERFSPYFDRAADFGFTDLRPARFYGLVYGLPEDELFELAYLFRASARGISEGYAGRISGAVKEWTAAHPASRLVHWDLGDELLLASRRAQFDWKALRISDPVEVAAFRLLDDPRSVSSLVRRLTAQCGVMVGQDDVWSILDRWQRMGVVFAEGGQFIHLAPAAANQELARFPL